MNLRAALVLLAFTFLVGCGDSSSDINGGVNRGDASLVDREPIPRQRSMADRQGTVFSPGSARFREAPDFRVIDLPSVPFGSAIWGATGRDDNGNIYLGISCDGDSRLSATLCRIPSGANHVEMLGDAVSQLQWVADDPNVQQSKIHSKPVQADDGFLYFTSQDEEGEQEDGSALPKWGSHLWRIDPTAEEVEWEHVRAFPEALIATACAGRYVYALGYFDHVIYQYDTESRSIRRMTVGSAGGHISRNFLVDTHESAYVPRVTAVGDRDYVIELVQFNTSLVETSSYSLEDYGATSDFRSHGLVGFSAMKNGDVVFVTAKGALYQLQPSADGPAELKRLGWIHPDGESYTAFLVCPDGESIVCGLARRPRQSYQWVTYDLASGVSSVVELNPDQSQLLKLDHLLLYGSNTRDDEGRAYMVGQYRNERGGVPFAVQVSWPRKF